LSPHTIENPGERDCDKTWQLLCQTRH